MNPRTAIVLTAMLVSSSLASAQIGYIYTYAGNDATGSFPGNGGPATNARITNPAGLAIDNVGNLYIAASGNSLIRKVDANTGIITTVAGGGTGGDGGLATDAQLLSPCDVKLDPWNNLYISETCVTATGGGGGSGGTGGIARIRRVDANTGIITTIAGGTSSGFSGDGGPATSALLNLPAGLAIDGAGNVFVADSGNHRIRRIDRGNGLITTVAGNGVAAFAGDGGPATLASLNTPAGLTVDAGGNLYIAEAGNNVIRRVDGVTGIITTVAGTGATTFNGDGIAATAANLNTPVSVILNSGNLVFSDLGNYRVRTIDNSGIIWTLAGDGYPGTNGSQIGDGASASFAVLNRPFGLASIRAAEPLFISELAGDRVREEGPGSAAATAVTVSSTSSTAGLGAPVTLTATLVASNGQGSNAPQGVYFFDGTTMIGSGAMNNGSASMTTSSLALGVHNITGQYIGDFNFGSSISPVFALTISASTPIVSLNASPNPAVANQTVTLTAFVTPSSATGVVTFYSGATPLGSGFLSGGVATRSVPGFAAGTYSLTAQYGGDTGYTSAVSSAVSLNVKTNPSIVVTSSLNPSTPGQSVTFTATITPATATGTMQFFDGGTPIGGSPTVASGTAIIQMSTLAAGSHSITASYAGDANNGSAVSPTLTQTVNKTPTTVTVTSTLNSATTGFPVTFNATVSPSTATGTIQFLDGATTLGSGTLANGAASFTTSTLTAGSHSITVVYGGDAVNAGSTSAAITVSILAITTVTLTSNQNPVPVGAPVILTATVSPAGATGTVEFQDGFTPIGTATLVNGSASFTTTTLAQGTHPLRAVYSGDANNSGASYSPTLSEGVKLTTGMSLTSSLNPSVTGQTVTFNATVNPAATGTIQFLDGAAVLATVTVSSGAAAYSTSTLSLGSHGISVSYSGDANYMSSQSAAMTQTVNAPAATVTSVTSTQNPAFVGAAVTFIASVSPATATGTVQFLDGATVLGTGALASGSASFSTSALAVGAHSITAVYGGDAVDSGSTSAALTETINSKANTVTSVTSTQNPATAGAAVTFTASVSPTTAIGTVQFLDGATVLGTGALASGAASFTTSALTTGAHSITAVYGGDAGDNGSTSAVFTQTIKANTTSSVTSTQNPAAAGAAVTFTVTVTPATATGNVQFLDGATVLGTGALASGSASFSTSSLAAGAHSITAVYGGDAADNGSTSAVLTQTINPKANTVTSVTSAQNPSIAGASVTFTATVSPSTATGTVQFLDGGAVLGTAAITAGSAAFSTSALAGGTHPITAVYSGDAANATSTSAVLTQTVKLTTTLNLQSGLNPSVVGQAVTFTATVAASGTASGTVQFLDGGTVLGTVTLSSNVAQFSTAGLSQGAHSLSAVYSGDSNYTGSNGSLAQTVNPKTATSTVLGSSWNPAIVSGGTVTFTADVSPMSATGTVQFLDGATVLGTGTLVNGEATFGSSTLSLGTHSITAVYSGNATTLGSTSAVLTQSVKQLPGLNPTITPSPTAVAGHPVTLKATMNTAATGTVTFTDGATVLASVPVSAGSASYTTSTLAPGVHSLGISYGGDGTFISAGANVNETILATSTLLLSSSVNPGTAGQSITFSANVTPASATGTVQFFDGATLLGTSSVSAGLAQLATSALVKGSHSVTAIYSGDPADAAATSNAVAEVVRAASTISLTSNVNPSLVNQSVKFTATITPSAATGTVQFLDGATVLHTVSVAGGAANFTTTQLAAGVHSITAIYGGDTNDAPVTSAVLSQTVNLPPPSAPGGLNASASGPNQVNLSWNASPTSGVTYNVYMSTSSGFTPSASNRIATGVPSTAYSATGLASATQYHFRVTAADAGGESAATSQASATTAGEFACHVVYNTSNQTGSTFSGTISIQNTGTLTVNSWSLTWTWAGNQQITQSSNSHFTQSGNNVTLTNTGNGRINAGSALNGIGFNANYSGTNTAPTAFFINGTNCQ